MKYAWIEADRIRDICAGDPVALYHPDIAQHYDTQVPDDASNGDGWIDGVLVKPEPAPPEPYIPPPPPVPQSVTMRQARLALHAAGLLSGVDAAIASMQEPAKTAAIIEWEYASSVERNAGLVPAMATALGMTDAQIDDLFITAATL